jgi:hypothetical protein
MAALNKIAKEYADEIRDGIAWVIVWKTGRSWNAQAVWLSCDDTFELEDLSEARQILEADPNAVMLNGYYCGHFGEDMTIAELADGIRWHYERGCNLLKNSDTFPPEPMERPEGIPADMPWYGKQTSTAPDPYIYDGYMSVEDYEHMHELMAADRQQNEELDQQNVELTLSLNPEQAKTLGEAIVEMLKPAIEYMAKKARELADIIAKAFRKAAAAAVKTADRYMDALLYNANDHPEWWHYYKHAKKYRVRKKYRRRLMQQLIEKLRTTPGQMEVST